MKPRILITVALVLSSGSASAATIYVDGAAGADSPSCGDPSPCRSIEHAVEQRAASGDVVMVHDGTYTESTISFPLGVSLTAVNQSYPAPTVRIVPPGSLHSQLELVSTAPVQDGSHEISYIDITGMPGTNYGIRVEDRSNIHIHHVRLHDRLHPTAWTRAIRVVSTEANAYGANWTQLVPHDGRDLDAWLALWTFDPVENIEIDHCTIIDWGRIPEDGKAGPGGIHPVGWKGGSIHHCTFEATNPGDYIKFIQGTGAYLQDVDIHDNEIISHNAGATGSVWSVELWGHINTRIFNNTVNLPFSWTYGYGSEVFNNTLVVESAKSVGIEGIGQSNYRVYNNYVHTGADGGINVGHGGYGSLDHIIGNVEVFGNVIERVWYKPVCVYGHSRNGFHKELRNVAVHHNTASKIDHYGYALLMRVEDGGSMLVDEVSFDSNIVTDAAEASGKFANHGDGGTLGSYRIDGNIYHGCGTDGFDGLDETNALVADPLFVADTDTASADEYMLLPGSPAIDVGADLGLEGEDLWGNPYDSAPNIGAFQGLGSIPCIPDWSCEPWSTWSACLDGEQERARTCTDSNACDTEEDRPEQLEVQPCGGQAGGPPSADDPAGLDDDSTAAGCSCNATPSRPLASWPIGALLVALPIRRRTRRGDGASL